ncbi:MULTISPECIES: FeoA family protein [Extibacter]|uniref:Ferrous iron transport protein A n=1 Tax=Extibacter muris TaxID=1796622 RepID=A0A4R4FC73_9FIRM|nr:MULTISPECIES: FeoA family protein [Extibacter]MBO1721083.1 ferrous iron transport protein A [Extibacter sp. GGCC_0201]MCU0079688.1 ferrous iron transport protein A [Extibacter muris]RGU90005.1 ferrous iron transport protein A [Clostridium sp. AF15-17LB]TDA21077.1 ferrous iron transport protein A [Extibacter muris]
MMPLTMLGSGETASIKRVGGQNEVRKFLESLGFVTGEEVKIVSVNGGNIIVQVKESRVAVSKGIANKIMV